jgi:iron complex outermembrane receptor protein
MKFIHLSSNTEMNLIAMCPTTTLRRVLAGALLFAGMMVSIPSVVAQTTDESGKAKPDVVQLDPFSVNSTQVNGYQATSSLSGTKLNTKLIDTPLTITVLPQEFLKDTGVTNYLDEALTYIPNAEPGDTTADGFTLRGFSATKYTDGVAVASQAGIDPAMIERVEVAMGPSSVLYGVSSPGGLVNVITKSPLDYQRNELEVTAGSYNYYRYLMDSTGPLDAKKHFEYRVVGAYLNQTGSWKDYAWHRRIFVSPMLTWHPSGNTSLTLKLYRQVGDANNSTFSIWWDDVNHKFANLPRGFFRGDPSDTYHEHVDSYKLSLIHRFPKKWVLQVAGLYTDSPYREVYTYTGVTRKDTSGRIVADVTQRDLTIHDKTMNLQINVVGKLEGRTVSNTLLAGVEFRGNETYRQDIRDPWANPLDIYAPNYGNTLTGVITMNTEQNTKNKGQAPFIMDTIGLFNDRLQLVLGGRYEMFSTSSVTTNHLNSTATGPTTLSDRVFTKRIGGLWKVTPELSAFATYNEGFDGSLGVDIVTGQLLRSETSRGQEAGLKFDLGAHRLSGALDYFEVSRDNITQVDPGSGAHVQIGQITSTGVELNVFYQAAENWQVIGGVGTDNSRVTRDTNPAHIGLISMNAPKTTAALWTRYNFATGYLKGFFVGLGGRYESSKTDSSNVAWQAPSTVINGLLGWQRKNVEIRLNLNNLFNEDYWSYIQLTRAAQRGAPLEARLTASYKF